MVDWARHVSCASRSLIAAAVAVLWPSPEASAEELRYSAPVDVSLSLAGAGLWVTSVGLEPNLAPDHCRWCDRDASGRDTLNPLDREVRSHVRWRRRWLAHWLSNTTGFIATPLWAAGGTMAAAARDGRSRDFGSDSVIIGESAVLAADLNELVKLLAMRERPDAHARSLLEPGVHRTSVDDDLSFYSGHTTAAVSLAVAAGTVSSLRGYRLAPLVWSAGLPLALATGYFRIAADRHYFTDVLVGALAGAAVGVLIPALFHRPESAADASPGMPTTPSVLSYSGVW